MSGVVELQDYSPHCSNAMMQADESILDEMQAAHVCKRRIEHLKENETLSPAVANQWQKKRLDRMLVEYFLRSGYYTSAIKLAHQSGIEVRHQRNMIDFQFIDYNITTGFDKH